MTSNNPFADRLRSAAASVRGTARRDGLDQVRTVPFEEVRTVPLISERQHDYAVDLLDQRDLAAETRPAWRARLIELREDVYTTGGAAMWGLDRAQASALIDCLLDLPIRERAPRSPEQQVLALAADATDGVPAGRYAYTGTEGHTVFVKVDRPTEGRWAGYTFVGQQIGDDMIRISRDHQAAALFAIAQAGIAVSAARYGHELGICGVCGRTLTNEESRDAGIGPVCRANMGW